VSAQNFGLSTPKIASLIQDKKNYLKILLPKKTLRIEKRISLIPLWWQWKSKTHNIQISRYTE